MVAGHFAVLQEPYSHQQGVELQGCFPSMPFVRRDLA